jgi:hypothetical protein
MKTGRPDVCVYKRDITYHAQNGKVYVFFAPAFKQLNSSDSTITLPLAKPHKYRQMTFSSKFLYLARKETRAGVFYLPTTRIANKLCFIQSVQIHSIGGLPIICYQNTYNKTDIVVV